MDVIFLISFVCWGFRQIALSRLELHCKLIWCNGSSLWLVRISNEGWWVTGKGEGCCRFVFASNVNSWLWVCVCVMVYSLYKALGSSTDYSSCMVLVLGPSTDYSSCCQLGLDLRNLMSTARDWWGEPEASVGSMVLFSSGVGRQQLAAVLGVCVCSVRKLLGQLE